MSVHEIEVITHDGYRANERPKEVVYNGERLFVTEVEEAWIETGVKRTDDVCYGFLVRCHGGARFRLLHVEHKGWRGELLSGPRLASNTESR